MLNVDALLAISRGPLKSTAPPYTVTLAYFDPYLFHGKRESDVICLDKPIFYAMAKTFARRALVIAGPYC